MNIVIDWPQFIYICLTLIGIVYVSVSHGKTYTRDAGSTFIATMITFVLLYWGGFFS